MSVTLWKPRRSMVSLMDDFFRDDFWPTVPERFEVPAVNIAETDKAYNIEVAAPGMKKADFHIEVEAGNLVVSAEVKHEEEKKEDHYTRKEFNYTSFKRSFWLPENVKEDAIKANYKEGVLYVTLPKSVKTPAKVTKTIAVD
ncbi:MAG TPA: Hsp20/alpha crystallin family protein [Saprospiraceae bacterium]|nr:Hsp20/alpha crystallin family protein [Saprospiraceae bacterium]